MASAGDAQVVGVQGVHDDEVAVRAVPGRGSGADVTRRSRASLRSCTAPSGSPAPSWSPAPLGSSVTEAGMSATAQCQKPLAVGRRGRRP